MDSMIQTLCCEVLVAVIHCFSFRKSLFVSVCHRFDSQGDHYVQRRIGTLVRSTTKLQQNRSYNSRIGRTVDEVVLSLRQGEESK